MKPQTTNLKPETESHERIHKVLARAGLGSRRQIEDWIRAGKVNVNGRTAILGDRIGPGDRITMDGKPLRLGQSLPRTTRVLAYYKPAGELTTRKDEKGRRTVFDTLPGIRRGKWIAIGRLDMNTSGLLLFTNNGELADRLMHPATAVEREYAVRILGRVSDAMIGELTAGVRLEDGMARFTRVTDAGGTGANHWYNVILTEGRNREVRRLWESRGVEVSRLIRIRFGPCLLPSGKHPGQYWELEPSNINALCRLAGLTKNLKLHR